MQETKNTPKADPSDKLTTGDSPEPASYRPEMLIPFQYSQEDAIKACSEYYRDKWLLPGILRKEEHYKEIQGGFVPYLLYSGTAGLEMKYEAQDSSPVSGDEKVTRQLREYEVTRNADAEYYRVQVNASKDVPETFMHNLEPFRYKDLTPVEEAADADLMEGLDSIRIEENEEITKQRITDALRSAVKETVKHDYVKETGSEIDLHHDKVECVLFPMWILISKVGRKYYHFAMNGQTGQIAGDLPFARWKASLSLFGPTLAIGGAGTLISFLLHRAGIIASSHQNILSLISLFIGFYVGNNLTGNLFEKLRRGRPKPASENRYDRRKVTLTFQEDKLLRRQMVNAKNVIIREDDYTLGKGGSKQESAGKSDPE